MVGWHHSLSGHEFGQTPGDGEGQGSLASCSPWGHKEPDTTERLNNEQGHTLLADGSVWLFVSLDQREEERAFWGRGRHTAERELTFSEEDPNGACQLPSPGLILVERLLALSEFLPFHVFPGFSGQGSC